MSAPETSAPPEPGQTIDRFSRSSRWVHWLTAVPMIVCILTAAVLYNGQIAVIAGHRYLSSRSTCTPGSRCRCRWSSGSSAGPTATTRAGSTASPPADWAWLRSRTRRDGTIEVGKFNAGQKLNAALSAGSIGVLLISGVVMYFTNLAPLSWRSGATFVHDWFALAVGLLVVGHIVMAVRDPYAMSGMRTGRVPLRWARREHGGWAREVTGGDKMDP